MTIIIPGYKTFVTVSSALTANITVNSAATNRTLGSISIPAVIGNVSLAFLSLHINEIQNTNVAANALDGVQNIEVNDGSGWVTAIALTDLSMFTNASSLNCGKFRYDGIIDLSTYITSGGTLQVRWGLARSTADNLVLKDIYTEIKILTGG